LFGNPSLLWDQLISVGAVWVYSFIVTFAILKILDWTLGLRISEEEESDGLDLSQHGESGYTL
ncbi:MAG: ammonium transporter Amt family, partial [bacterium]